MMKKKEDKRPQTDPKRDEDSNNRSITDMNMMKVAVHTVVHHMKAQ